MNNIKQLAFSEDTTCNYKVYAAKIGDYYYEVVEDEDPNKKWLVFLSFGEHTDGMIQVTKEEFNTKEEAMIFAQKDFETRLKQYFND